MKWIVIYIEWIIIFLIVSAAVAGAIYSAIRLVSP